MLAELIDRNNLHYCWVVGLITYSDIKLRIRNKIEAQQAALCGWMQRTRLSPGGKSERKTIFDVGEWVEIESYLNCKCGW